MIALNSDLHTEIFLATGNVTGNVLAIPLRTAKKSALTVVYIVSADPGGGEIQFFVSLDGINFQFIDPGINLNLPANGSKVVQFDNFPYKFVRVDQFGKINSVTLTIQFRLN